LWLFAVPRFGGFTAFGLGEVGLFFSAAPGIFFPSPIGPGCALDTHPGALLSSPGRFSLSAGRWEARFLFSPPKGTRFFF